MHIEETYKSCLQNLIIDNNQYSKGSHDTHPRGLNPCCSVTNIAFISCMWLLNLPNLSLCKNSLPSSLEHEASSLLSFGLKFLCPGASSLINHQSNVWPNPLTNKILQLFFLSLGKTPSSFLNFQERIQIELICSSPASPDNSEFFHSHFLDSSNV